MRKVAARARWVERLIRTGEWASRHVLPFLVVGVAAGLVHRSVIETDRWGLVASGLLGAVLVGAIVREVLASRGEKPGRGSRAVTELRILVPAAALMQITVVLARSASLELGALLYLFALVTVTFFSRTSSVPALVVVLLLEWVQTGGPGAAGGAELSRRLATTLFLTFFGAFGLAFLRTEIVRIRAKGKERLEESIRSMSERAREYRLTSAPSSGIAESDEEPRDEAEERQMEVLGVRSSLNEIHSTIYTLLEVVRRTMGLHTCILLWKDGSGEYMKIIEAATGSSSVVDMPIPAGHGLTGVVAGRGKPVRICPVAEGSSNVPYYSDPEPLRSICIVPVVEGSVVRGVLCADRLTEDAFDDSQVRILERIADQSMRIITNERVFLQLVKSKTEQMRLYRASTRLRDASGCDEVLEAAFESMRSIVSWDLAVATRWDGDKKRHEVLRACGQWADQLGGLTWRSNEGLVSQVVRLRFLLPHRGNYVAQNHVVFTKRVRFKGARSLIVLPLVTQDRALGTLVLVARKEGVFTQPIRQLLQVVADQTALSWQNALMVKRLEEMATRDGLTGLYNKRVFLEALGRHLRTAQRFGSRVSLIMTDLDKFKNVNDTYGHQVGDRVLKRFAAVVERNVREVDMACRYGGEEFAIICQETDTEGAYLLAERIRTDMAREVENTDKGDLTVTCSLGVATSPEHASEPDALIEAADQALYRAKEGGRDMVVTSGQRLRSTG